MVNELDRYIVLIAVTTFVIFVGTVWRFWILRGRQRSFSVNFSDAAALLFSILSALMVGVASEGINSELAISRKYGDEGIDDRLMTDAYFKRFFLMSLLCTTQIWLLKAAFLGYFWSLRESLSRKVQVLLYIVSAYVMLSYVGVILLQIGYCRPISRNWTVGSGQCISVQTIPGMVAQQGTNVTSDILIFIIPFLTISSFRSNYSLARKDLYALAFVFGIGSISIAASVVRFTQVWNIVMGDDNTVHSIRQILKWAIIEKLFAFIAFCLPSLRVFYRRRHSGYYADKIPREPSTSLSSDP